ncbi:BrnT family toxin [Mesorhizobium sp.]|uniref:BrnT family toxin n=1 Tax=Mesorhizobium sp. TaxID=1871066 RepID=UPI0026A0D1B9
MKIVWDEIKRRANISKHGMDFADLEIDLFYAATILPAQGKRFMAIGGIEGIAVTVVFSRLGSEAVSIVLCGPPARRKGVSDDG